MNYQNYTLRAERRQPWHYRQIQFAETAPRGAEAIGWLSLFFVLGCLLLAALAA